MSTFKSPYLTQNYHSKYVERSSGKNTHDKSMTSLDVFKMKAYCSRKNRSMSKSIDFLKLSGRFQI